MKKKAGAQLKLKKNVLEQSLCTGCGACVGLCPYQVIHADRTVQLFACDLAQGKCHAFCPRTPADYGRMRESLFEAGDWTPEIGPVKAYWFTRAADGALRDRAQHGGTVTALLRLAMAEGVIDAAIVSGENAAHEREGRVIENADALGDYAGSRFTVSPTVAAFNRLPDADARRVGVVATPCQALALAKMKTAQIEGYRKPESVTLVIGLFCGWTLGLERFQELVKKYGLAIPALTGMDIPAGKNVLELRWAHGTADVPLAEVDACVRTACRFCIDSTAEFADLSVGAARSGGDSADMRGWNQVIVRSRRGQELLSLAREKGVLEVREAPKQALADLKKAAAEKKKSGLAHIVKKSRSFKNLLYLKSDDPVGKKYLGTRRKPKNGKS